MTFATEQEVRLEANLFDCDEVSSDRLANGLAKAHQDILEGTRLTDDSPITTEIRNAEIRLAVSHLFRALVISSAVSKRNWRASGLYLDETGRMKNLATLSEELWEEAWALLRPYLRCGSPDSVLVTKGEAS